MQYFAIDIYIIQTCAAIAKQINLCRDNIYQVTVFSTYANDHYSSVIFDLSTTT